MPNKDVFYPDLWVNPAIPASEKAKKQILTYNNELKGVYEVYLADHLLPQTPSKITYEYADQTETIRLANEGNLTIPRYDGPMKISFDFVCSTSKYPYTWDVTYMRKIWTDWLWIIKNARQPVYFEVCRTSPPKEYPKMGDGTFNVSMKVLITDWSFVEDAEQDDDFIISITLMEYCEQKNLEINADVTHHLVQNRRVRGWTEQYRGG